MYYEEELDTVYSTLLINHFKSVRDFKKAELISEVLEGHKELDPVTCLGIRIKNFQSVQKYRNMQQSATMGGRNVFQSYFATCAVEKFFLPGFSGVKYEVVPPMNHPPSNGSSIDAMEYLPSNFPDLGIPHIKAQRFYYDEAIAMSIKDLEPQISAGLTVAGVNPNSNLAMNIRIKHGGDGMGEVKRKNLSF